MTDLDALAASVDLLNTYIRAGLREALEHDCRIVESALRQVNSAAADASWLVIRAALAATDTGG